MSDCRITMYDNGVVQNKRVGFNPFKNSVRTGTWTRRVKNDTGKMETSQYDNMLREKEEELKLVRFDEGKTLMLTLGTSESIEYHCFQNAVKKFITIFRYHYGKVEYIRGIECYRDGLNRYHCHLIVFFQEKAPTMNQQWLKEHWIYGKVNIRHQREFEYNDPVRYITKFKANNIDPDNSKYTKFPQFVSPIRTSRNLPKANIVHDGIHDKETSIKLHDELVKQDRVKTNTRVHVYGKEQKCFDSECFYNTQNSKEILDKILEDKQKSIQDIEDIFF